MNDFVVFTDMLHRNKNYSLHSHYQYTKSIVLSYDSPHRETACTGHCDACSTLVTFIGKPCP